MDVTSIGVLGAGVLGGGIAQVCAIAGYEVVVYDIDPAALTAGHEHATTGRFGLESDCYRWPSGPFGMVKGAGSGWS